MLSFRNTWTSKAGHSDRGFRRNALRAMTEALADLDSEGLFGTGKERESITIFLDITDSNWIESLREHVGNWQAIYRNCMDGYEAMADEFERQHPFPHDAFEFWAITDMISR